MGAFCKKFVLWYMESLSLAEISVKGFFIVFVQAFLQDDVEAMNAYMNKAAMQTFSYFDTESKASEEEPERFYHGFVLGLIAELADRYVLTSDRESGFGRYDEFFRSWVLTILVNWYNVSVLTKMLAH